MGTKAAARFLLILLFCLINGSVRLAIAEVLIGIAAPFTGQTFYTGEQVLYGVELAVAELNEAGGVAGHRISITTADDACDAEQALAAAEKLVSEGVVLVIGHVCSGASIPAAQIYSRARIPMISPASTSAQLTESGSPYVFRVVGRDDNQGVAAGNFLADHFGTQAIAVLHDNQTYGRGLAEETLKQLHRRNISEVLYEGFTTGEHDYGRLVDNLSKAKTEVVYIGSYVTEAALIIRQAREQGLDLQLVAGDGLSSDEFWLIAGPAGNGALFTFPADPRKLAAARAVVERFRAQGFEPEGYTLHAFAAVQAWAQATQTAGSFESERVAKALHADVFTTVLGEISFNEKGDINEAGFSWHRWQDGEYAPLDEPR